MHHKGLVGVVMVVLSAAAMRGWYSRMGLDRLLLDRTGVQRRFLVILCRYVDTQPPYTKVIAPADSRVIANARHSQEAIPYQ